MDINDNVKDPVSGVQSSSSLQRGRHWDSMATTATMQRRELSPVPKYRRYQGKQENVFVMSNDSSNHHHVSFAPETSTDASPELHTLAGHNMWIESSESKRWVNTNNNHTSNQVDVSIPDRSRARGPLKKRLAPPGPPTQAGSKGASADATCLLRYQTSSSFLNQCSVTEPLLRQAASSLLLQQQNGRIPPQLRMRPSFGQCLIAEPLLETPQDLGVLARRSTSSSFQPHPSMRFTPAENLSVLRPSTMIPPVVSNPPDTSTTVFREPTPCSTLRRAESDEASPPSSGVHMKNREEALALLYGSTRTSHVASANQIFRTMHPFDVSSRGNFRGVTRKPIFSPSVPRSDADEKTISRVIRLPVGAHPRLVASKQRKPKAGIVRPKKVKSNNDSSGGSNDRGTMGAIVKKSTLFKNVATSNRPCKCGSTKCLKLYCECFHNAQFCNPRLCRCRECFNTEAHNSIQAPQGARVVAILSILQRRPRAFVHGGRKAVVDRNGCHCKKSG
jgi:hypothetical protein